MLYIGLRPNKRWRLVSYLYYAKYAIKEDSTFFRHIDINLNRAVNRDYSIYMI